MSDKIYTSSFTGPQIDEAVQHVLNGDVTNSCINVTYEYLLGLRNTQQLVPGQQYRITDYVTTAYQYDRYCNASVPEPHQFDLIVEAITNNTLYEKAKAVKHDGDDYFAKSNLAKWEIWYDLDNNRDKYAWAYTGHTIPEYESYLINGKWYDPVIDVNGNKVIEILSSDDGEQQFEGLLCKEQGDEFYYALIYGSLSGIENNNKCRIYANGLGVDLVEGTITGDISSNYVEASVDFICYGQSTQLKNGKGVIYRMIDEFGNDCPYDFKNIKFGRTTVSVPNGCSADNSTSKWLNNYMQLIYKATAQSYTYAGNAIGRGYRFYEDDFADDASITVHGYGEIDGLNIKYFYTFNDGDSDASLSGSCYNNTMKPHRVTIRQQKFNDDNTGHDELTIKQSLNNNVFFIELRTNNNDSTVPSHSNGEPFYYQCYNNRLEGNCYMNSIGSGCYNLTMGENCHHNILGIDAADITMGKHNRYINLGNYCRFNVFDNYCLSIATGNDFNSNKLGNACRFMSFKADCSYNTFGINCMYLRFGEYCRYNQFGNYCNQNLFRDYMFTNTFGNYCNNLSLGTRWQYNTFGNNVKNIVIPTKGGDKDNVNYFYNNRFLDGLSYVAICASSVGDKNTPVKNYTFHSSISGNESKNTKPVDNVTIERSDVNSYNTIDKIIYRPYGQTVCKCKNIEEEGYNTIASGTYSHAEGYYTTASGVYSHAEGQNTTASGAYSHAEGFYTTASGWGSHAEGIHTIAKNDSEHACGKYNNSISSLNEADATLFSIGRGTSEDDRQNAFEVKANGDVYIAGTEKSLQMILEDIFTRLSTLEK